MWREDVRPVTVQMGRLLTISQAGAVLDRSEREVRRMIGRGQIATVRIGRRVYVPRDTALAVACRSCERGGAPCQERA